MVATEIQSSPATDIGLDAPVRSVTLFEDRAQANRRGSVKLAAGSQRLLVRDVTPLLADRTLIARLQDGLRLDDVKVKRRWRIGAEEQPAKAAEVTEEIRRVKDALRERRGLVEALDGRRRLLRDAAQLHVDSVNREMPFASGFEERWERELELILDQLREQDGDWRTRHEEIQQLERELEAARLHRSDSRRPDHYLAAELVLDVNAAKAGTYEIEIEYTVACALWRPVHRATLQQGAVRFECEAAVWQATGEDWHDVELRFSTARSTQRADPPLLHDDLLRIRKKRDKKVAVQVRETTIATTGEGAAKAAEGLPGVDDGGETRLLNAMASAELPADGRMRRVPVFAFEAEAELDRICCQELAPLVHLRSRQANSGPHPLLAGPVDLVRESGYVGRAEIGFVATGERFALGWGSEDGLRVRREPHEKRDTTRITGKQIIGRRIELSLSTLDDAAVGFSVQERVPVSEIDKVKIEIDKKDTAPLQAPDDQGVISWPVKVAAHGTEKIKLVYTITASSDVQGL